MRSKYKTLIKYWFKLNEWITKFCLSTHFDIDVFLLTRSAYLSQQKNAFGMMHLLFHFLPQNSIWITYFLVTRASFWSIQIFSAEIRFVKDFQICKFFWTLELNKWNSTVKLRSIQNLTEFDDGENGDDSVCSLQTPNRL